MNVQNMTVDSVEKVLTKLKRAEKKHGFNRERAQKIVKFQNILGDLLEKQPKKTDAVAKIVVSSGKNHARATSVSGIKHFKSWLKTIKN